MSNLKINTGVRGRFTLSAVKGGETVRSVSVDNMILNQGLDYLTQFSGAYNYCRVGTSGASVDPTQTGMISDFGVSSPAGTHVYTNTGSPEYIAKSTVTYTFALGQIVGNVAEVGAFRTTGANTAFSRALIVDSSGNPTVFPVLSDEQLQVTYIIEFHPSLTDKSLSQTIGSTAYSVTARISLASQSAFNQSVPPIQASTSTNEISAFTGSIGPITGEPSGSRYNRTSYSESSYVAGSWQRTLTITFGPSSFNGQIKSIRARFNLFAIQWEYDSPVAKTGAQTLVIPVTISWGRI